MYVRDLNREQIEELKVNYLCELADEGSFASVTGKDYDSPSMEDIANADSIVSDEVIYENYEGINFTEEDFSEGEGGEL